MKTPHKKLTALFAVMLLLAGHLQAQELKQDTLLKNQIVSSEGTEPESPPPPTGIFNRNLITPSPDGCALMRSINVPVDKYTGVANIQVPITEIKIGEDKSVPVVLSYQASGIKVADVASTVGLGWRLSAGGRISRAVRGWPDKLNDFSNRTDMLNDASWTKAKFDERKSNNFDSQPDLFYFEYPGGGGMFVFDDTGIPRTIPGQNINIHYFGGQFTITDIYGTEYLYSTTETSYYSVPDNPPFEFYISSWFLNHIRYANGSLVVFNYLETPDYSYENANRETLVTYNAQITTTGGIKENVLSEYHGFNRDPTITIQKPKYLSSIRYKDHVIEFSYGNLRTDIAGLMRLDRITVSYNQEHKMKYALTYGAFTNNSLKLLNIKDVSINSEPLNICSFEYYEDKNIPDRKSLARDHWGYFNSDLNTNIYQPETDIVSKHTGRVFHIEGNPKNPSLPHARANTIRSIRYATGGSKEFEYELHAYTDPTTGRNKFAGGLRIRKIIDRPSIGDTPAEYTYAYSGGVPYVDTVNYCSAINNITTIYPQYRQEEIKYYLSSDPVNDVIDMNNCSVIYSSVVERLPNGAFTEYKYVPYGEMPDLEADLYEILHNGQFTNRGIEKSRMSPQTSRHFRRNLLQSQTQYSAEGAVVQSTNYEYRDIHTPHCIHAVNYYQEGYLQHGNTASERYSDPIRYVAKYYFESQPICLTKVSVQKGMYNLPSTTSIEYDTMTQLPTEVRSTDCEGNISITTTTYSKDYPTASLNSTDRFAQGLAALRETKIQSAPVEIVTRKNGRVMDANLNLYTLQNDKPVLTEVRKFYADPEMKLTTFPASHMDANKKFVIDSRYETTRKITQFDVDNTPLTTQGKGYDRTSVIYGYRNTLPIAVVQNADHSVTDVVNGKTEIVLQSTQGNDFVLQRPQVTDFYASVTGDEYKNKELEVLVRRKLPKIDTLLHYFITPTKNTWHFSADLPAGTYSVKYRWTPEDMSTLTPNVETRISQLLYQTLISNTYKEVFHTSFEEEGSEQPIYETAYKKFPKAKTGEWVCQTPYTVTFDHFMPAKYELTFWAYDTSKANPQWELVSTTVRVRSGAETYTIPASASRYIDEVRVLPAGALMTTFSYKPNIGKLSQTDPAGITEQYVYDAAGRLTSITDSEGQLVKRYTYSGYNKVIEEAINGNADLQKNITYLDGLGRREQVIQVAASPDRTKDLVSFWSYDEMGRDDAVSYLPYAAEGSAGLRRSDPYGEQTSFFNDLLSTTMVHQPYVFKFYDSTPQGKILKTRMPRDAAMDESPIEPRTGETSAPKSALYETTYTYGFNTVADQVRRYVLTQDSVVKWQGHYAADKLLLQESRTPRTSLDDASLVREFFDSENRKVMSETFTTDTDSERTYYVYDDFGRLRYTIPEPANAEFGKIGDTRTPWQLRTYCYYTAYDRYGRAVRLLNPGAGWTYKLYDSRDREVMSQSEEMRKEEKWMVTHYDLLNRPLSTNIYTGGDFATHCAALESAPISSYPYTLPENDLTRYCYDNYDEQPEQPFYNYTYDQRINIDGTAVTRKVQTRKREYVRGLETRRGVKVLGSSANKWLYTTNFYDDYGHLSQTVSDLYPGGTERVINQRNANGNLTYVYVKQQIPGEGTCPVGYGKEMAYDHRDRVTSIKFLTFRDRGLKIRPPEGYMPGYDDINGKVTVAAYTYDDLGRVKTKSIHNGAESTTYQYDLAGRQLSASSRSFSYTLGYDFPTIETAVPRYDGLLSEARWKNGASIQKAYVYTFNRAGYMTAGRYTHLQNGEWLRERSYSENVSYGTCGRISEIRRMDGNEMAKRIIQNYDGFQTSTGVIDGVGFGFIYDSDGRLIVDSNQGVYVQYNILGLPDKIFDGSHEIRYLYDAGGRKLAMSLDGSDTYYRNTLIYNGSGDIPAQIIHPEGFVSTDFGSGFLYNYHKKDHAGNVRVLLTASGSTLNVRQATDYYPFGLAHSYNDLDKNRWLYSGKELQDGTVGKSGMLGWYDYGARMYNPVFGHWFAPDPAYQALNPYLFCGNAPMCYVDRDGEFFFSFLFGFFEGLITGKNPLKTGWHDVKMSARIIGGLFTGSFMQILSRLTWELPQTLLGMGASYGANWFATVDKVEHIQGATVTRARGHEFGAFTLGSFILGDRNIEANPSNSLFQHEYGHYLQSQNIGLFYLGKVGIRSLISAGLAGDSHKFDRMEIDASKRSLKHWEKQYPGMYFGIRADKVSWDKNNHPVWWKPLNMDQRNSPAFNAAQQTNRRRDLKPLVTENEEQNKLNVITY